MRASSGSVSLIAELICFVQTVAASGTLFHSCVVKQSVRLSPLRVKKLLHLITRQDGLIAAGDS